SSAAWWRYLQAVAEVAAIRRPPARTRLQRELPGLRERNVTRLRRDAREPSCDRGILRKIEVALAGAMGVGVERNIGHGIATAGEPILLPEMRVHDAERGVALGMPFRDEVTLLLQFLFRPLGEPEARHRHVGLVAVL